MLQDAQPSIPGLPASASGGSGEAAQTLQPADGTAAAQPPPAGGISQLLPLIAIVGVFVLMIFMSGRSQKKEQRRKQELLASLRKHDKVQTIGGIIGSISEIRDDEVVLIIDDQSKTKLRIARSAVQQVLRSSSAPSAGDEITEPTATPDLARTAG